MQGIASNDVRTATPTAEGRSPATDWAQVLQQLVEGDAVAHARVTGVVMGLIVRARVFDLEQVWEEICQDVLTAIVRSVQRGAIRDPNAFVGYAAVTVRHEITRHIAQARRRRAKEEATDADTLPEPARRDADVDVRIDLERALGALPERQRSAVQAIYLEGHSYEEAAERLGMPLGTLKRLQTAGLRALRGHLGL